MAEVKEGKTTSEYKLTAAIGVVVAVATLAMSMGWIPTSWETVVGQVLLVLGGLGYNNGRVKVKTGNAA